MNKRVKGLIAGLVVVVMGVCGVMVFSIDKDEALSKGQEVFKVSETRLSKDDMNKIVNELSDKVFSSVLFENMELEQIELSDEEIKELYEVPLEVKSYIIDTVKRGLKDGKESYEEYVIKLHSAYKFSDKTEAYLDSLNTEVKGIEERKVEKEESEKPVEVKEVKKANTYKCNLCTKTIEGNPYYTDSANDVKLCKACYDENNHEDDEPVMDVCTYCGKEYVADGSGYCSQDCYDITHVKADGYEE